MTRSLATRRTLRVARLAWLGGVACSVHDVDYSGKSCPCPDPWECVANVCRKGSGSGGQTCTPGVVPQKFRFSWTTPNTIRWAWDPDAALDPSAFGRYELLLGKGDPGSADTSHPDDTWTAARNPELGIYRLPHSGSDDPVGATVTDGLSPATSYWGRLVAYDNTGCASFSTVLGATTPAEPASDHAIAVFHDAVPPGAYVLPSSLELEQNPTLAFGQSAACLAYDPPCTCGPVQCECVLQIGGLNVELTPIGFDVEKTAFLEVAIATAQPSFWSSIVVGFGPDESIAFARVQPCTFSGGDHYRLLQIPLHALSKDAGGYIGQRDATVPLTNFGVQGAWEQGSRVRIDEIRVRW